MSIKKSYAVLLLFFFLMAYILPLGSRDLLVPDETRYAEIPREMIARGDWVVPHLNGLRYFEKPPLGYWVHAASLLLFGETRFAVRLPSAVAVGLSALLIFVLVRRACRNKGKWDDPPSILAPLVFMSCFAVAAGGNIAVLDSLFSFFVTATIVGFFFATESPAGSTREKHFLLLAGLSCGLALLTKGFLAVVIPVLSLAPYLIWERRYFDLLRMSWLPILAAVLTALPWSIAIQLREPDFWRFFFWNEHIRRFIADNAQHKEPFWFFFQTAPGMLMPWTFLITAAAAGIRQRLRDPTLQGGLTRLSVCWLALPFLFFSASNGKLTTYVLPCFPPFAILMAFGLSSTLIKGKEKAFHLGAAGTAIFFGLILLALIYIQVFGYGSLQLYSQPWKAMMVVNGLVFMILFCFWSLRSRTGEGKVLRIALAPLLLFLFGHFAIPDLVIEKSAPGRLLEKHQCRMKPDAVIICDEEAVGAACWNLKRDNVYLLRSGGELSYGLHYEDAAGRLLDADSASRMIERNPGNAVLIARQKRIRDMRNALPEPAFQDDSGPQGYVLWQY